MIEKDIVNFFFELGILKRAKRSGWWLINIKDPETIGEHCFRCGVIGYVLAKLENVDTYKVSLICFLNDLHETRLNDLHKIGHRYIDFRKAETEARKEQTENLGDIGKDFLELHNEFQAQKTKESIVARDADLLENAVQAKEYIEIGYKDAQNWINNVRKILKTKSAKKLLDEIEKTSSNQWWKGLKKIER